MSSMWTNAKTGILSPRAQGTSDQGTQTRATPVGSRSPVVGSQPDWVDQGRRDYGLEKILAELEKTTPRRIPRDAELYFVTIFGQPATNRTWGWRWEGHHLALNFTLVNGQQIAVTPSFMGTNPAEVKDGPRKGLRILAREEDLGRQLLQSLSDDQKKIAIFAPVALRDIVTGNQKKVKPLQPDGLAAAQMNAEQKAALKKLIEEYVRRYRPELADQDLAKIEQAGFDKICFAWAGGEATGQAHYYRVQGPTYLIGPTMRRTTPITSTRCGAISTGTSARICSANTTAPRRTTSNLPTDIRRGFQPLL